MRFRLLLFSLIALALGPPAFSQTKAGPFAITAANQCAVIGTGGQATVGIQVIGTFSATLQPEVSIQGQAAQNIQVSPSTTGTPQSTITGDGIFSASVAGFDTFLLCASSYASGTATVYLNTSTGISAAGIVSSGGGVASVSGTANQVTVSPTTGAAVVSLPSALILPGTATTTGTSNGFIASSIAATSGANQTSAPVEWVSHYWDGSVSQPDTWGWNALPLAGTGPTGSRLSLSHSYGNPAQAGPISVNFGTTIPLNQVGSISTAALGTPTAPTVTPISTGGGGTATTWTYVIVARDVTNVVFTSPASPAGTTAVGSSTLDSSGTQQNNLTWTAITGAASYAIYRTVAGGTPSSLGLIGTSVINSFSDTGQAGDASTAPTLNTTPVVQIVGTGALVFSARAWITSPSAGVLTFNNTAGSWASLQLGGTTNAFPSIQRSGATIQFRLADSSADAAIKALTIQSSVATGTAPFTVASTTVVPNLNASSLGGATFASPGAIGGTTASTGAFTTLSASSTVSGTGFSTYLASPPAIGGTAAAAVTGTTIRGNTGFSANGTAGISSSGVLCTATFTTVTGIVTACTAASDRRLKSQIKPFQPGLTEILMLHPVLYHWNKKGQKITGFGPDDEQAGFIAQDVRRAIPEASGTEVDGGVEYYTVRDRPIIAALVNAVQEQQKQIEELKKQVQELKSPSLSMSTIPVVGSAAAH